MEQIANVTKSFVYLLPQFHAMKKKQEHFFNVVYDSVSV